MVAEPVRVWGIPLAPLTSVQLLEEMDHLISSRQPAYVITANLNYAMLTERYPDLSSINHEAAFVVADGMPLLWAARWAGRPLPERVAGSDLIFQISERAARKGYRVFLLGGAPGVADAAAAHLANRYPGFQAVGIVSPPYRDLTDTEHAQLVAQIRAQTPDILIVAFSQPKGERWIHAHYKELGVPFTIQVGASIDFAAKRVQRAPRWMQKTGLEWLFRLLMEPRRLASRYYQNASFLLRKIILGDHPPAPPTEPSAP